jgi:hypothetical protein
MRWIIKMRQTLGYRAGHLVSQGSAKDGLLCYWTADRLTFDVSILGVQCECNNRGIRLSEYAVRHK